MVMDRTSHQYKIRETKSKEEIIDFDINDVKLENAIIKQIRKPEAEKIILEYEYLKSMPKFSKYYYGIFFKINEKEYLGGVLVFSDEYSINQDFWEKKYGFNNENTLLLSRGVCLWWTPKNTASFFISRVLKIIKNTTKYKVITATIDPKANEVGIIYQSLNWFFVSTMGQKEGAKRFCAIIDGKERGSRFFREKIKTIKKEEILKHYPDAKFLTQFRKSRYFYFIGNKKENEFFKSKINHLIKPYPEKEKFLSIYNDKHNHFIIYKITNLINNKVYIGQTIRNFEIRVKEYKTKKMHNIYLENSFNKYGFENFKFEIIENCSSMNELNDREIYWINHYDSTNRDKGYNINEGGRNSPHSDETKLKISFGNSGKKRKPYNRTIKAGSEEAKRFGKTKTEEEKKYLSEISKGDKAYWFGKKRDEETNDKIRKTKLEKGINKKVCRYDMDSQQLIDTWDSIEYASKMTNVSTSTIRRHCTLDVKKYETPITWRYYDDIKENIENNIPLENLYEKTKDYKKVYNPTVMKNSFRNRKKIKVTNKETLEVKIFDSITDCAKEYKVSEPSIKNYCNGKYCEKLNNKFEFI